MTHHIPSISKASILAHRLAWCTLLCVVGMGIGGCAFMGGIREHNRSYFVREQVRELRSRADGYVPTQLPLPISLMAAPGAGAQGERRRPASIAVGYAHAQRGPEAAFAIAQEVNHPHRAELAMLLGHYSDLALEQGDTLLYLNAQLMLGSDSVAGMRALMDAINVSDRPEVIATHSSYALVAGDSVGAMMGLRRVAAEGAGLLRLAALRHLTVLGASEEGLRGLERYAVDHDERRMAIIGLRLLQSVARGDSSTLLSRSAVEWDQIRGARASWLREWLVLQLLPTLRQSEDWVLMYDLYSTMGHAAQSLAPEYLLLLECADEVAVMRRYESADRGAKGTASGSHVGAVTSMPTGGVGGAITGMEDGAHERDFRSIYGTVSNVDNWAIDYVGFVSWDSGSSGGDGATTPHQRPTQQAYKEARQRIAQKVGHMKR